jgi:hypothetical protein
MEYAEVTKRSSAVVSLMSASDQETLCYTQRVRTSMYGTGGKVTSVRKTGLSDPATAVNFK